MVDIEEMWIVLLGAMQMAYAARLPPGFIIHTLAEYSPDRFPAPNLWFEKRGNPAAKYIAILTSDTAGVPALGETVTAAIDAAIAKIEDRA